MPSNSKTERALVLIDELIGAVEDGEQVGTIVGALDGDERLYGATIDELSAVARALGWKYPPLQIVDSPEKAKRIWESETNPEQQERFAIACSVGLPLIHMRHPRSEWGASADPIDRIHENVEEMLQWLRAWRRAFATELASPQKASPLAPTNGALYQLLPGRRVARDDHEPVKVSKLHYNLLRLLQTKNRLPVALAFSRKLDAPWRGRYQHDRHFATVRRTVNRMSNTKLMDLNLEARASSDDMILIYPTDPPKILDRK